MTEIYLHVEGKQTGPYSPDQARQLLAEGKISNDTLAWHQGVSEWTPVATVLAAFSAAGAPPVFIPPPSTPPVPAAKKGMHGCVLAAIIVAALLVALFVFSCLAGVALGPITAGIKKAKESASMQTTRAIELAMFSYANDHNGAYPDGKTSTEVFQKLIDEKYISDPGLFYLAMPGKTRATSSTLTAANVSYDVTAGIAADSSDSLPVVFCTGYTASYTAGSSAVRDPSAATPFPGPGTAFAGLAVSYKNHSARFLTAGADGTVLNFIPANFDPGLKTYRQLTP